MDSIQKIAAIGENNQMHFQNDLKVGVQVRTMEGQDDFTTRAAKRQAYVQQRQSTDEHFSPA